MHTYHETNYTSWEDVTVIFVQSVPPYIGSLQTSACLSALSRPYVAFRVKREPTSEEAQERFVTREGNTALKKRRRAEKFSALNEIYSSTQIQL